ncbi:magnesium transporter CorA family protein [Zongyangia hominis]|nr:CorA family divalent cation transporter [Zongyangia hominis]
MPMVLTARQLAAGGFSMSEGEGAPVVCRLRPEELFQFGPMLGIPDRVIEESGRGGPSKLESHDGFDFLMLNVPDHQDLSAPCRQSSIYFRKGLLVFTGGEDPLLDGILSEEEGRERPIPTLLLTYFDRLTGGDFSALEGLEEEIEDLEDALITKKKDNCIREIIELRKKLRVLHRYYEQLSSLLEAMEENSNGLLDKKALRFVHLLAGRADRLCGNVRSLRDYVTQVREAYQAQVDISLNSLMKLFTVVTTIFLPLSLIAGWYGMNFPMPEYRWALGYPVVICVSVAVVVVCILLFKKKKWL